MIDLRRRTLTTLEDLSQEELDFEMTPGANTIASLVYHLAYTKMNWLFIDVCKEIFPPELEPVLPHEDHDAEGRLWPLRGTSLSPHLERLRVTREILVRTYAAMSARDFRRKCRLPRYEVTPEWVLYHLLGHEAHHRGQMRLILAAYSAR